MTTDELINQFKSVVVRIGTTGVMAYLVVQIPFFGLPVVRNLTEYFISKVLTLFVNETELVAYFTYTDIFTKEQASEFETAALKNKLAQEGNNEAAKKVCEAELIDAARKLIRFAS